MVDSLLLVFSICILPTTITNPDTFICAVQVDHPQPCLSLMAEHYTHFDFKSGETQYTEFYIGSSAHYHDYPHYNFHKAFAQPRAEWIAMKWRHFYGQVSRKHKKILFTLVIIVPIFAYLVWTLLWVEEDSVYDQQEYLDRRGRQKSLM